MAKHSSGDLCFDYALKPFHTSRGAPLVLTLLVLDGSCDGTCSNFARDDDDDAYILNAFGEDHVVDDVDVI